MLLQCGSERLIRGVLGECWGQQISQEGIRFSSNDAEEHWDSTRASAAPSAGAGTLFAWRYNAILSRYGVMCSVSGLNSLSVPKTAGDPILVANVGFSTQLNVKVD